MRAKRSNLGCGAPAHSSFSCNGRLGKPSNLAGVLGLTIITTGNANTAYGNAAVRTKKTDGHNTAVGTLTISFSNTGNNNTGIGSIGTPD